MFPTLNRRSSMQSWADFVPRLLVANGHQKILEVNFGRIECLWTWLEILAVQVHRVVENLFWGNHPQEDMVYKVRTVSAYCLVAIEVRQYSRSQSPLDYVKQ